MVGISIKVAHAVAAFAAATYAAMIGALTGPRTAVVVPPSQTAIIYQFIASPTAATTSTSSSDEVISGLLPTTTFKQSSSSIFGIIPDLLPKIKLSRTGKVLAASVAATSGKAASTDNKKTSPNPAAAETKGAQVALPKNISALWMLDHTTVSLVQRLDSTYRAAFSTETSKSKPLGWDLGQTSVGGSGGIPQFDVSYACDIPPFPAPPAAPDQSPVFLMRTYYSCDVSLTPTSGVDLRTQTKNFSFKTDGGRLKVMTALARTLVNGKNDSGFIFNNEDSEPVTLTGLTLDISFTALSVIDPLVIRFADGKTEKSIVDYPINGLPDDQSIQFTKRKSGIQIPLSFTIKANSQRLLAISALGVQALSISSTTPAVEIDLVDATFDRTDVRPYFNSRTIKWYCVVPQLGIAPADDGCGK